ncbi:MAG TPA: hypothetical protein VJQ44_19160 [Gemmatimonadales bacterium]|nr:hypothetical protein [Gemmatimonadales bacterium]
MSRRPLAHSRLPPFAALLIWTGLTPFPLLAQDIADNSFLIEEAYNQEAGVVQHISTFSLPREGGAWNYGFTQEWPLRGVSNQFSYTLPMLNPEGGTGPGIGDIALNYRYQLVARESADGVTAVHVAPRASLILPTGSESEGRGTGEVGIQANLPVSWVMSSAFVTHWNAGATLLGSTVGYNLGASGIYRLRRSVNLLLEATWLDQDGFYLNPGVRWAYDFASGLQVVPGLAYTVALGPDAGPDAFFLYLSFEHRFRHQ